MVSISKPKLLALAIIMLVGSTAFYLGQVLAIPAPTITSVIEPGSMKLNCNFLVYLDNPFVTNVTMARNCQTGQNDFKETTTTALLQDIFSYIGALPAAPNLAGTNPAFLIEFAPGSYYTANVNVNIPNGGSNAYGLGFRGAGEDKTSLTLIDNTNADMFTFTAMGNKMEVGFMKFLGNRSHQSGTSYLMDFASGNLGGEFIMYHDEFRDCLTACVQINSANVQWTTFQEVWMLNAPIGINFASTRSDIRVQDSKFASLTTAAIDFVSGNLADVVVSGNIFDASSVLFPNGGPIGFSIVSNLFFNAPARAIEWDGTGLGGLTNVKSIVASNVFITSTGTNVAVYIGNRVDGITVTSNQFSGYTSSATVPVTLIQTTQKTTTLVTQNSGMGASWTGFGIAQPAVPATTVNQANNNPYQVRIYISGVGSGITAYKVTDPSGTANTFTTTVAIGYTIELDPYAQVALTFTGSPTWLWYGEANLA